MNNIDVYLSNLSDARKEIVKNGMVYGYKLCDCVMNE